MAFDEQLRHAVDTLHERLRDEHRQALDEAVGEAVAEAMAAARAATPTVDVPVSERLVGAVRALDAGRSLTEILDMLATSAAGEVSRAGVLLVRGDLFCGWRFIGFGSAFAGEDDARAIQVGLDEGGVLADAVRTGAAAWGEAEAPAFVDMPDGHDCFAAPLIMGGQIVAVLYADHAPGGRWTDTLEILARHAARCLEALTAAKAARALTERPDVPTGATPDRNAEHAVAQRHARLLVSEIKMYHEADVIAGIQDGDLAIRLGGEMAHARSLYEQRVPPAVRQQADYFHAELVRTLANGDQTLLEVKT